MFKLRRLMAMGRAEAVWRARALARIARDRAAMRVRPAQWRRADLLARLSPDPAFDAVRTDLQHGRFDAAHHGLAAWLVAAPQRFVIAPRARRQLADRIRAEFPHAPAQAAARADRIVNGEYDLLGYTGVRFAPARDLPDWHLDPVHGRRAPRAFWADVPYLEPACGDHKVIWELNRHQHWLTLGRAWWLTDNAAYRDRMIAELEHWIRDNPPLEGINWASMLELAFRSISWVWAIGFAADGADGDDEPWLVDLLLALDRQLRHIEENLSYYFSPNTHLLGEALALYVCGQALPALAASERRATLGRRILIDQSRAQIGRDGGHLERSTHYHRYTLDFYCLALAVARGTGDTEATGAFTPVVERLAEACRALADGAGRLPHIGDDDGGATWAALTGRALDDVTDSLATAGALTGRSDLAIGPCGEEALWLLAHPKLAPNLGTVREPASRRAESVALLDMGYYVARSHDGDHLVIDGGPHGYRNAGHAHADALALTFTVRGVPMLIDPGTGAYTIDVALRDRLRSTVMHNTAVVDGVDQSLAEGPFHWRSMANAVVRRWTSEGGAVLFEGVHDGYGAIEHRRSIVYEPGSSLTVADTISGQGTHDVAVHWHVDPRWTVEARGDVIHLAFGDCHYQLRTSGGAVEIFRGDGDTGLGWHSPVYGRVEPATTVRITTRGELPLRIVSGLHTINAEHEESAERNGQSICAA